MAALILVQNQIKKSNFRYTRLSTGKGVASWRSPSLQLAPRPTVQGCIGGESMATCVNLTDSGFEPNLASPNTYFFEAQTRLRKP